MLRFATKRSIFSGRRVYSRYSRRIHTCVRFPPEHWPPPPVIPQLREAWIRLYPADCETSGGLDYRARKTTPVGYVGWRQEKKDRFCLSDPNPKHFIVCIIVMPRPIPSTFSKTADGRTTPASPRWGGAHGSGSGQSSPSSSTPRTGAISRRGVTAVSSPRAYPLPLGNSSTRGSSAREPHVPRNSLADLGERGTSGSVTKNRKSIDSDHTDGDRENSGDDSGRIRVAVRVCPIHDVVPFVCRLIVAPLKKKLIPCGGFGGSRAVVFAGTRTYIHTT